MDGPKIELKIDGVERRGKVRDFEIEGKLYKLTDYVYKIAARPARATPRPEESEDKE